MLIDLHTKYSLFIIARIKDCKVKIVLWGFNIGYLFNAITNVKAGPTSEWYISLGISQRTDRGCQHYAIKKDTERKVIHGRELRLMPDPVARAVNKYFPCLSSHLHKPLTQKHSRELRVIFLKLHLAPLIRMSNNDPQHIHTAGKLKSRN